MTIHSAESNPATVSIARIRLYIKEMYPWRTHLAFAALWGIALVLSVQAFSGIAISSITIFGSIVFIFFIGLNMRIYDELKDLDTDKILFPERLIPSGKVKLTDLYFLCFLCYLYYTFQAVIFPYPHHMLAVVLFAFLTFRWFFMPKTISKNLVLAFISHQPLSFLVNIYLLEMISGRNFPEWEWQYWLTAILYALPLAAWEIGRKIRAAHEETEYVTYSKIMGSRFATAVVLTIVFISLALSLYLYQPLWKYKTIFSIITIGVVLFPQLPLISFLFFPEKSSAIKPAISRYILVFLISQILFLYFS
jgi:hypothetical protein